jgi:chromosome segregation ATPase
MNTKRFITGTCLLLVAAQVFEAQSRPGTNRIANLSAQLNSAKADKAAALSTVNYVTEAGRPIQKEIKIYDEQILILEKQLEQRDAKLQAHKADKAVVDAKVHAHNAVCHGELPKPQYDRCKGEEPYLQSQINRVNRNADQLGKEGEELKRRGNPIIERHRLLSDQLDNLRNTLAQAEKKIGDAETRIASLAAQLQKECKNAVTGEDFAHCGQMDFDGAEPYKRKAPADPSGFADPPRFKVPAQPIAPAN